MEKLSQSITGIIWSWFSLAYLSFFQKKGKWVLGGLLLVWGCSLPRFQPTGKVAYIEGTVSAPNGKPAQEAFVYAYKSSRSFQSYPSYEILEDNSRIIPPETSAMTPGGGMMDYGDFRGPADYKSSKTGPRGHYHLSLPPGEYFLVARRRADRKFDQGPLSTRDFSSLMSREVSLKDRQELRMNFQLVNLAKDPLFFKYYTSRTHSTILTGILSDPKGDPLKGFFITADKRRRIGRKPDFVSQPTDDEGKFVLYLAGPGKYFLGVKRSVLGKPLNFKIPGRNDNIIHLKDNRSTGSVKLVLGEPDEGGLETLTP